MAEFKRAFPTGSGAEGEFDYTTLAVLGDMTSSFWPLMLGTVLLMLFVVKGDHGAVVPVAGGMMLLQAWHSGLFG